LTAGVDAESAEVVLDALAELGRLLGGEDPALVVAARTHLAARIRSSGSG
jgi:hypothetical protein